jgi:peptide/nickel transport system permease protein
MAFPLFVLAMAMVAALGNRVENIVIATAFINLPFYIRFARAEVNVRRNARLGRGRARLRRQPFSVVLRFLLPNVLPAMVVQMSLNLGWAIINAAGLSFIGLGVKPPTPEWGIMVAEGARFISTGKWWLVAFPGLALMLPCCASTCSATGCVTFSIPGCAHDDAPNRCSISRISSVTFSTRNGPGRGRARHLAHAR